MGGQCAVQLCVGGTIAAHVANGGKVALVGFGTFSQKSRGAHLGRNPQTGAPIKIAASKSICFKTSKAAKPKEKATNSAKQKEGSSPTAGAQSLFWFFWWGDLNVPMAPMLLMLHGSGQDEPVR